MSPRPLILSHILLPMCIILRELLDTSQSPLDALLVHDLVEAEHADDGADAAHHGAARHEDLLAAARQPISPGSSWVPIQQTLNIKSGLNFA